jgi:hypothetical protein
VLYVVRPDPIARRRGELPGQFLIMDALGLLTGGYSDRVRSNILG